MSIRACKISKSFGVAQALNAVDLEVGTGKLVALLGPSGSGKTTLLRILAGLDFADPGSGGIQFHGQDVTYTPARKRQVGMVFQHYALFRHMTVFQNVAFGMRVKQGKARLPREEIRQRVKDLLRLVQLEDYERHLPSELSGGQRQRVALARSLAIDPKILLLDEPFGALDAKVRKDLRRWLRQFHEEIHMTTLFVTHDQEEALELADEVVVMDNGQIVQLGHPQSVYDEPASPFVMEFLGNVNKISRNVKSRVDPDNDHVLYVRPHDIVISRNGNEEGLPARILHIFSAGSVGRVILERIPGGDILEAEISRAELEQLQLREGEVVTIYFRHIRLFRGRKPGQNPWLLLEGFSPSGKSEFDFRTESRINEEC